jgi:hypothetical protein
MSRKDLLVLGLWCAAVLALLAPVWARPGAVFFNHGDLYTYHVPLRSLTAAGLQGGRLPFWNPYIMLGVPHAANPQAALFYPPGLLADLLPVSRALTLDEVFHLLWAGIGMFLLARAQRLERWGAAVLTAAYALSPFLVYRVTAGIPTLLAALAWVPWLWLAWLSGSTRLLAAALALQMLSGHGQFLVINAAGMALWAAFSDGRFRLLGRLAAAGVGAAALTAVQWILTAQFLSLSVRSGWSGAMSGLYALPPGALWTWLSPGALGTPLDGSWSDVTSAFYEGCAGHVGLVALALAAAGLVRGRRRLPAVLLALAGIVLSLGPRGAVLSAALGFAVLSYLRTPVRWLFLTEWAVLLLAGAGLASLRGRRLPRGAGLFAALAAFLGLAAWDAAFLRPQDPAPFLLPRAEISEQLAGRPLRILTDPALANPNKAALYRMLNVNGYEAFYLKGVPAWAAAAEGAPAADASRVYVSRWPSEALERAGVSARLSPAGIDWHFGWPLAYFVDSSGRRVGKSPKIFLADPQRWRVLGDAPPDAVALALSAPAYPGWRAWLNGAPTALAPWGGVFQAAPLAAAERGGASVALTFEFRPTGWAWLAALTAAAWAAWLLAALRRAETA